MEIDHEQHLLVIHAYRHKTMTIKVMTYGVPQFMDFGALQGL